MKAWLQSSDFSSRDLAGDLKGVLREFESHDWRRENVLYEQLGSEAKENCPAGLGLVRDDGQILHICPHGDVAMVHWHRPQRVLGFLWHKQGIITREGVDLDNVGGLIASFYEQRDDKLEEVIAGAA